MFNFIKKLFKNDEQKEEKHEVTCNSCILKDQCNTGLNKLCQKYHLPKYDKNKKNFLLIDDNEGIISFLEDDLHELFKKYNINEDEFNIIKISGQDAAINIITLLNNYSDFKIDYAIIDLTYGAILKTSKGNIKFDGVDIACELKKKNPNIKFLFFTGNTLNPYLNTIKNMIEKFKKCFNDDIQKYIIFKNQYNEEERIKMIYKLLFKGEK